MVDTVRPPNNWPRVTSTAPVKKIGRRKEQQEGKKFREQLAGKHKSAGQDEAADSDRRPADDPAATEAEGPETGSQGKPVKKPVKKPLKKIDIVI